MNERKGVSTMNLELNERTMIALDDALHFTHESMIEDQQAGSHARDDAIDDIEEAMHDLHAIYNCTR